MVSAAGWVGRWRGANVLLLVLAVLGLFLPRPPVTPDSDGLILVVDSLRTLLGVAGVVLCVTITGSWIMRRLHRPSVSSLLELVAAFLIGSAVTGSVLMAVGLLGHFSALTVRVVCIAFPLVLLDQSTSAYIRRTTRSAVGEIRTVGRPVGGKVVLLTHAVFAVFLLLIALGPMISRDAASYHIEAPEEFLEAGSIYHLPDDQHLAFVSTFQILNAVLLASVGEASVAVLHWVALVFLVALVGVAGARLDTPRVGWIAMAFLWSAPIIFRLGSEAMTDVYLILSVFVVSLWVATVDDGPVSRGIIGLSLITGSALLVKYQAGPYLIGAGLALVLFKTSALRDLDRRSATVALTVPWLLMAPLLAKNSLFFGAPLYPFGVPRHYPRWISDAFDLPPRSTAQGSYAVTVSGRNTFSLWRWLIQPETLSNETEGRYAGYPMICLAAPLGVRRDNWRTMACLALPALTGIVGVIAVSSLTNPRYLLPAIPVAAILASLAFVRTISTFLSGHHAALALALLVSLAVVPFFYLLQEDLVRDRRYAVAVGAYSWSEWAEVSYRHYRGSHLKLARLNELLVETVEQNESVLLLFDRAASIYDVETIQDNLYTNWPMLEDLLQGECLEAQVANYIVWGQLYVELLAENGTDMGLVRRNSFNSFASECLEQVASLEGYVVYRVSSQPDGLTEISG